VLPGRPDDAGESVGECDGGFVVTALAFAVQRPVPQAVEGFAGALRPVGREQCRASPVHQERSAVHIPLLGDFAEAPPLGTGALRVIFALLYAAQRHLQGELGYFWFRSS
jgi:hypothetical protein